VSSRASDRALSSSLPASASSRLCNLSGTANPSPMPSGTSAILPFSLQLLVPGEPLSGDQPLSGFHCPDTDKFGARQRGPVILRQLEPRWHHLDTGLLVTENTQHPLQLAGQPRQAGQCGDQQHPFWLPNAGAPAFPYLAHIRPPSQRCVNQ